MKEQEVKETDNAVPIEDLMRFEAGDMDEKDTVAMFQRLVDSGLAWQLQGFYGRTADQLIRLGYVHR